MAEWSRTWTWFEGEWLEGNPPLIGPRTQAAWLGASVFDGARGFEGLTPDLDRHCQRVNASARALGLKATMEWERIEELAKEGFAKFPEGSAVYIRPMYWAEEGLSNEVSPDPESTRFCLCIYEKPMPEPTGSSITLSPFRRPTIECMPTNAKAGCLYPNNARALQRARDTGFDNALVLDMLGNVAELATANVFLVRDGRVYTPMPNGTFLNGITRQRIIALLREAGYSVTEATLRYEDFHAADEIFSTGNYAKVSPITRIGERTLEAGPVAARARELYWEWARG